MKTCSKCKTEKPADLEHFYANPKNADRLDGYCKVCRRETSAARPEHRRRDTAYKAKYGISIEEFNAILTAQGGVCAICAGPPHGKRYLSVDHNPQTGMIRGLLCDSCNRAIGMMRHDPQRIRAAAAYLEKT